MGTDYRFRKNHYFYLSFLPKSKTNYSFWWKTILKDFATTTGTDFFV